MAVPVSESPLENSILVPLIDLSLAVEPLGFQIFFVITPSWSPPPSDPYTHTTCANLLRLRSTIMGTILHRLPTITIFVQLNIMEKWSVRFFFC